MRILLAFDKFKGALTAAEACDFAAAALRGRAFPDLSVTLAPLTDGGEGFCSILSESAGGVVEDYEVADPLGRPARAPIGWIQAAALPTAALQRIGGSIDERVAVIEMASASGLPMLAMNERDPWVTTTRGTGELLRRAAESGADRIVLGVGGSATNDCGAGALEALGVKFFDQGGREVSGISPARFAEVDTVDFSGALRLPPLVIASDVQSPLLGASGATHVFGPQKGLVAVEEMERAVETLATRLAAGSSYSLDTSQIGMGAAGGIPYGLSSVSHIHLEPGFSLFSDWMGLAEKLGEADCIVTGEGKFDRSSLTGKGPVALIREAVKRKKRVLLLAGAVEEGVPENLEKEMGREIDCIPLSQPEWPLLEALGKTRLRLEEEIVGWVGSLGIQK